MREIGDSGHYGRLDWHRIDVQMPMAVDESILGDFLEVSVEGHFLAIIARYQSGKDQGLWIGVDNRAHLIPEFISGKVFTDEEMRKALIRYAVREGLINHEEEDRE